MTTTIIRSNLVISGKYTLTDATQVATGITITVLPGATLDFGGFSLLNFGTLSLEGNANTFAVLQNGTYSTDSASGILKTSYGNLKSVDVDGFFSRGTLQITNSLIEYSHIDALQSNSINKSIFISSPLDFGIEYGTVDQVTFSDSTVSADAWPMLDPARLSISNSNFIGSTPVISLDPFFAGYSHGLKITDSFIRIPTGSNFESMVYDANDDLKVISDLDASTFLNNPIINNNNGFTVGSYTFSLNLLQNDSAPVDLANHKYTSSSTNEFFTGGAGTDTALYSGKISDYLINYNRALGTVTITDHRIGGDGTDSLKSIEKLQFTDKTFDLINLPQAATPGYGKIQSFLFDAAYYLLKNPELVPTVTLATAYDHYKTVGAAAGDAPNIWFDPVYYANKWADLKPLNLDNATLFMHYNLYGVWEGRSAGPAFDHYDGKRYLAENPDVAAYVDTYVQDFLGSRSNGAIAHYVIYGANEGRHAFDMSGSPIDQVILVGTPG